MHVITRRSGQGLLTLDWDGPAGHLEGLRYGQSSWLIHHLCPSGTVRLRRLSRDCSRAPQWRAGVPGYVGGPLPVRPAPRLSQPKHSGPIRLAAGALHTCVHLAASAHRPQSALLPSRRSCPAHDPIPLSRRQCRTLSIVDAPTQGGRLNCHDNVQSELRLRECSPSRPSRRRGGATDPGYAAPHPRAATAGAARASASRAAIVLVR
eukprot:scaffold5581_cov229-Prasinococcus_capsulatus_cf.AAC.9